jgi:hypothetical protein
MQYTLPLSHLHPAPLELASISPTDTAMRDLVVLLTLPSARRHALRLVQPRAAVAGRTLGMRLVTNAVNGSVSGQHLFVLSARDAADHELASATVHFTGDPDACPCHSF